MLEQRTGVVKMKGNEVERKNDKVKDYTLLEFVSYWIPELFLFPFRLILWMFRGLARILKEL